MTMMNMTNNTICHERNDDERRLESVGLSELLISRDAKRYRKLRQLHWSESSLCVVIDPKRNLKLGSYCPSGEQLDEAIDAIDDGSDTCTFASPFGETE